MLLDPDQLASVPPAEILGEVAKGHLEIDHRVLHALLDRPVETLPALVDLSKSEAWHDSAELETDAALLFHALEAPEGIPFLVEVIRLHPDEIPDEVVEALHFFGSAAIDPLLALYKKLDEEDSEEIAFLLASFHIRDRRIFGLLLERLAFSAAEGAFLLGIYGDPAGRAHLENIVTTLDASDEPLKKDIHEALELLKTRSEGGHEPASVDIYSRYPERSELPIDLLPEEDRLTLLDDSRPDIRRDAARSFFNQQPNDKTIERLLHLAQSDSDEGVRTQAWESLIDATENPKVVESLLQALRNPEISVHERASVLVGLSSEMDRNEVREALLSLFDRHPEMRAKALEAMWRSFHPSFRDYFAPYLDSGDLEVRRSAVWGVGYYGVKPALDKLRKLFQDEELRSDAIFAYAMVLPNDLAKSRMKSWLTRVGKDAGGLTEIEERLAMTALDERLMLARKEPYFFPED
jgi:HEAT repeat protein